MRAVRVRSLFPQPLKWVAGQPGKNSWIYSMLGECRSQIASTSSANTAAYTVEGEELKIQVEADLAEEDSGPERSRIA